MTIDRYFGPFAGNLLQRERGIAYAHYRRPPPGTAHCEGCARSKPIAGKSVKGWRCADCKKRAKSVQKTS